VKGEKPRNYGRKLSRRRNLAVEVPKIVRLPLDMHQKMFDTCSVGVQPMHSASQEGYKFLRPMPPCVPHVEECSLRQNTER